MKRFLAMAAIATLALGCNQEEENDDETISALLLLQAQNNRATTCNVTLSGFSQSGQSSNVPAVPITYLDTLESEVTVQFGSVPNTTHKIGAVNVTARVGTEVTFAGGNFFSVVFERGLG